MSIIGQVANTILRLATHPIATRIRSNRTMAKLLLCLSDYEADIMEPTSRIVEYPFVLSKLFNLPPGKVIDVGCTAQHNYIMPTLSFLGWETWGIDLRQWLFKHNHFQMIQGDIRDQICKEEYFDYVLCISVLEHIGLSGYYGRVKEDINGDFIALGRMHRLLRDDGILLLSIPYASEYRVRLGTRIYDKNRLKILLNEWIINNYQVFELDETTRCWQPTEDEPKKEGVICLELMKKD